MGTVKTGCAVWGIGHGLSGIYGASALSHYRAACLAWPISHTGSYIKKGYAYGKGKKGRAPPLCPKFCCTFAPVMLRQVLFVALGGALGSAARYIVSRLVQDNTSAALPLGTMAVNIAGCLVIGLVYGLSTRLDGTGHDMASGLKLLLTAGFCGGFTTFSTFCSEGLSLMRGGQYTLAAAYAAISVFVGMLAVQAGAALARM